MLKILINNSLYLCMMILTQQERTYFNRIKTEGKIKTTFENADFRKKTKELDSKKEKNQ